MIKAMRSPLSTSCPYCQSTKILKKWYKKKNSVVILWCGNCGFGWQYPYPSEEELSSLYKNQNLYHEIIVNQTQGGFPERIKKINQLKPEKGNILDIGSGMGHFLVHAKNSGWSVDGIEPRIKASDYCYEKFGIKVFNDLFEKWIPQKKFDVITLWDVMEHIHNPFYLFNKSAKLLTSGGLIVISIPNASGIPARLFKGNWRYVMRPHINYFTMSFIKKVLAQNQLKILRMDHSFKAQSIFEGIVSLFPQKINPENVYRKTYNSSNIYDDKLMRANTIKNTLRKIIFKFNLLSFPFPVGDLVDIYCIKS